MDVTEVLRKAWTAVEGAELPEKIHEVAFREAVRLIVPAPIAPPATRGRTGKNTGAGDGTDGQGEGGLSISEDEMYERVVAQTGVSRDMLEDAVHLDDDGPKISIPGLRLGRTNAERTRAVAQILTIVRGFALEENETSLEVIRAECERLKVYDSANFSSHLKALNGYVINGSGQNRRLRARGPGIAAFPGLLDGLLSSS
jgi:hypothetical protein